MDEKFINYILNDEITAEAPKDKSLNMSGVRIENSIVPMHQHDMLVLTYRIHVQEKKIEALQVEL